MEQNKKKEMQQFSSCENQSPHPSLRSVWETTWTPKERDFIDLYVFLCNKSEKHSLMNEIKLNPESIKNAKTDQLINALHNLKLQKIPCSIKRNDCNINYMPSGLTANIEEKDLKNMLMQYIER